MLWCIEDVPNSNVGLSFETKFDFKQDVELRWSEDFFSAPSHALHGQHPTLDSLRASMMRAVQPADQAAR